MTTDTIQIDGSQGEGGGQILRSSLALSMVTGKSLTIDRVRAGREKPGLMRQHLTAVCAAKEICGAVVSGDAIGSSSLTFHPGPVVPGDYHFAVGTAGSATLVLQTVLPPLLIADGPSRLILEGGTHNPWAPPFDFLQSAYLPLVNRMGPQVTAKLERHGFYPAGGGRFIVEIEPTRVMLKANDAAEGASAIVESRLNGFSLLERGEIRSRRGRVLLSNLPPQIAQREKEELERLANWDECEIVHETVTAMGPGNIVLIEIECEHVTEVFVGFGEHGVKSEVVVKQAINAMRDYLVANVPVGPYLADQLLLPLGISAWQAAKCPEKRSEKRPVSFRTIRLTNHSLTHIEVLKAFLGVHFKIEANQAQDNVTVSVE